MERVAFYIRTARASIGDVKEQNEILQEWARKNDVDVYCTYVDDGYSGLSTNRPAFNKLSSDLDNFDIIVTKDMARISRDYILTSVIQHELNQKGKRVVFIN